MDTWTDKRTNTGGVVSVVQFVVYRAVAGRRVVRHLTPVLTLNVETLTRVYGRI